MNKLISLRPAPIRIKRKNNQAAAGCNADELLSLELIAPENTGSPAVADTRSLLEKDGLAERCEVVPGDFFQAIPEGTDAYLLKYVIHDWDDERSLTILTNCRRAMTDDARLLLIETLVPIPGEPHFAKLQDLEMMVIAGSQERTVDEYSSLLDQAGFKLLRVVPTTEPASILATARHRADDFRVLPGLVQKYYVKLSEPNHYGGVYLWDSMESVSAFRESDLAASIPSTYKIKGEPTVEILDALFKLRT